MKLKVTEKGVSQDGKEIDVGAVLTIAGKDIPPSLVNKVVDLDGGPSGDEPKTYEEMTRAELDKLAEDRKVDVKEARNKGDVIAALQLADEAAKNA